MLSRLKWQIIVCIVLRGIFRFCAPMNFIIFFVVQQGEKVCIIEIELVAIYFIGRDAIN